MKVEKVTLDSEIEKTMFESINAKIPTETDMKNSYMYWGFLTGVDNYFFGRRDPKEFVQILQNSGFRGDWPLHERETTIARLAIKEKLRVLRESQESAQAFLNTLIAAYHSVPNQQEI